MLTEAQLDILGNDIVFLANPPKTRVYNSAAISHATSGAWQALTFDNERFDTDTMHSTADNTGRITFTTAGTYLIGGHIEFAANATGQRGIAIGNGTVYLAQQLVDAAAAGVTALSVAALYAVTAGSYVDLSAYQSSGGALNVTRSDARSPEFWAVWQSL